MTSLGGNYLMEDTQKLRLPKGHYWVGCMSYALSEEEADDLDEEYDYGGKEGGKFTLSTGRVVVAFLCDGTINEDSNEFPFDISDGTLVGITKLKGLEFGQQYQEYAGRVVHYNKPFYCHTSKVFNTKRDERNLNIYFGDKVSVFAEAGRWELGEPDDSDDSDDS